MPIRLFSQQTPDKPRTTLQSDSLLCFVKGGVSRRVIEYAKADVIFSQAGAADALFYVCAGTVILRVVSSWGKEAIIAILGPGDFLGEGCLTGEPYRTSTAVAMTDCSIMRLDKMGALRLIRDEPAASELFVQYLLSRNKKMEEDLVDQLFNTSEKRLARLLLQLANFDGDHQVEAVIPKISQETLAEIVGTTRSRVSLFMNKFRRLGLIDYIDHTDVLRVRSSLLNVVRQETPTPMPHVATSRPKPDAYCEVRQMAM